jgi:hypothetical protein
MTAQSKSSARAFSVGSNFREGNMLLEVAGNSISQRLSRRRKLPRGTKMAVTVGHRAPSQELPRLCDFLSALSGICFGGLCGKSY